MEGLWRQILKLLALLSLLAGSGDFSKMAREAFKGKVKKKVTQKVEEWKSKRSVEP